MKAIKPTIFSLAALLVLASCGGGSDSPKSFEGVYTGSLSNDVSLTQIILEDGTFWSLYGPKSDKGIDYAGVGLGKADSKDGKFNLRYTNFAYPGNKITSGTGSGTYTSSSAAGTVTEEGTTLNFRITKLPSQSYDYEREADLSSVSGSWSGKLLDGEDSTINILADGLVTGSSSEGCKFTGKFEPRPSKRNIFNVTLNFGDTPCAFPNQTASGIAFTTLRSDGKNELLATGVLASQKAASLFSAAR